MKHIVNLLLALPIIILTGCDFGPRTVSLSDPQLAPILQAMAASDRAAIGFKSIPTNALVYLDRRPTPNTRRDVEILIFDTPALYDGIYRNIEFRKTATGYKWLREFEYQPGPMTFKRSGHTTRECFDISFDTDGISGLAPNKMHVSYTGPDKRFASRTFVSLDEIRPILAEWSLKH